MPAQYAVQSCPQVKICRLGGWAEVGIRLADTTERHSIAIAPGDALRPLPKPRAIPLKLVVEFAKFAGIQAKQLVVLPVGGGLVHCSRPHLFEYDTLYARQHPRLDVFDGFHHGGRVIAAKGWLRIGKGAVDKGQVGEWPLRVV